MTSAELSNELLAGPLHIELAPFVASGNDGAIAEIMARKDIVVKGKLTAHDIRQYLMLVDLLLPIEASAQPSCKSAARALDIFESFDLTNALILAKFTAILDGLVAETLIPDFTETHKATLLAMADRKISRAEQLGFVVDVPSIATALRG